MKTYYYVLIDYGVLQKDFKEYTTLTWAKKKYNKAYSEKEKHFRIELLQRDTDDAGEIVKDSIISCYYKEED